MCENDTPQQWNGMYFAKNTPAVEGLLARQSTDAVLHRIEHEAATRGDSPFDRFGQVTNTLAIFPERHPELIDRWAKAATHTVLHFNRYLSELVNSQIPVEIVVAGTTAQSTFKEFGFIPGMDYSFGAAVSAVTDEEFAGSQNQYPPNPIIEAVNHKGKPFYIVQVLAGIALPSNSLARIRGGVGRASGTLEISPRVGFISPTGEAIYPTCRLRAIHVGITSMVGHCMSSQTDIAVIDHYLYAYLVNLNSIMDKLAQFAPGSGSTVDGQREALLAVEATFMAFTKAVAQV